VVFDAFVSLLETADDRGVGGASRRARARLATEDRVACRLADLVLLDTATHARYFEETFRVPARKLRRIWVGADDEVMTRVPLVAGHGFRVFVYASFIPLHGLEHVVEAAHLLERAGEPVSVDIVGTGATEAAVRALVAQRGVRSVTFLGARPYSELPSLIAASDVCLGIFGTSAKAGRVIPNKVFDALAVGRPVITADTPAAREVLTHGRDAWLCPPGDAAALAEALRVLRADVSLRAGLADRGHALFVREFSLDAIARELVPVVLGALGRSGSGA
jgi:glycosyltransferase involved in cell wall biosynthesis